MMQTWSTIRLINSNIDNDWIQMPTSRYERVLKVPFKRLDTEAENHGQANSLRRKVEKSDVKMVHSINNLKRSKLLATLPRKTLDSGAKRLKEVDDNNAKSSVRFHSADSSLRSRDFVLNRIPLQAASILGKNVRGSNIVADGLLQRPDMAGPFLSLKTSRERVKKHGEIIQHSGPRVLDSEKGRLSHVQTLQLFRGLMKEPLSFLELRGGFGVSKQTVKRLVRNGLLKETWGPKAVGVRFVLSDKGQAYLKGLEAAAKYKPNAHKSAVIRLKQLTPL